MVKIRTQDLKIFKGKVDASKCNFNSMQNHHYTDMQGILWLILSLLFDFSNIVSF